MKLLVRVLLTLSFVLQLPAFAQSARQPNIVFILADDLGYGDLGCYNPQSKIPTPRLDELARQGLRFTDAHSPSAVCTPTRYSLLTGRYPWRSRLKTGVLRPYDPPLIEADRLTLPALLKQQGYATAIVGKWHLGWDWPTKDGKAAAVNADGFDNVDYTRPVANEPLTRGFDYYFGTDVPNYPPYVFIENDRTQGVPTEVAPMIKGAINRKGPMVKGWEPVKILPALTENAVRYIESRARKTQPFFFYFALTSPHYPVVPAPEFMGKSQAGVYGDFVAQTAAAAFFVGGWRSWPVSAEVGEIAATPEAASAKPALPIRIGVLLGTFRSGSLAARLDAVKASGLDCVQLSMDCAGLQMMPDEISPELAKQIRSEAAARGITLASVAGTFNMCHPDAELRQKGLRRLRVLAEACPQMGVAKIHLCSGTRDRTSMWRGHPDNDTPEAWRDMTASMREAADIARQSRVVLAFEPEVNNVVNSAQKARRLMDVHGHVIREVLA